MSLREAIEEYIEKTREKIDGITEEIECDNSGALDNEAGWCDGAEEVLDFLQETLDNYPE